MPVVDVDNLSLIAIERFLKFMEEHSNEELVYDNYSQSLESTPDEYHVQDVCLLDDLVFALKQLTKEPNK